MPDTLIGFVRRIMTAPRTTFRFAVTNAMFVVLVARELAAQAIDD